MSRQSIIIILAALLQVQAYDLNRVLYFDSAELPESDFPNCKSDLEKLINGINDSEIWAYQMLDSSTKIPNGILTGNLIDFGNYDECLSIVGNGFATQHCMASITIGDKNLLGPITGNTSLEIVPILRWSYCLPASCPAGALQFVLNQALASYGMNATVSPNDCHANKAKDLSGADIAGISITAIFVAISLASTVYDVTCRNIGTDPNPWFISFSFYTNGGKLLSTKTTLETMRPLNGVRFLSIAWIVLAHRYYFMTSTSVMNLIDATKLFDRIEYQLIVSAVLAVDTFFLLSGLLNSYNLLKLLDKTKKFPAVLYYVHRYLRTTPALAAIVLMYATWYVLIGEGPAWDTTTGIGKQLCVDNWWPTLLYINNYYNPVSQCAGQSWYLAVDMQLYWISPFIILPLWYFPKFGKYYLGVLLVLSALAQFIVAYVYEFRLPFSISQDIEEYKKTTELLYVPTHTRATPYVIGIFLGYYLNDLRKKNKKLQLSKVKILLCWIVATGLCLSVILGNFQFFRSVDDHPYNRAESSAFIGLHRVAWSVGISWIIIACLYGYGGFINTILSWKLFVPLSRLTYCIFLIHLAVIQYQLGTLRTSSYFQDFHIVHLFFGDLTFSIIFSIVLSLMFESPVLVLEKLLLRKPKKSLQGQINKSFEEDKQ